MSVDWARHRVLIVAPHPDDEAIGCGGLISRVKREGGQVFVLWMTIADIRDFSPTGLSTAEQRRSEMTQAQSFWPLDGCHLALPGDCYNLRLDTVAVGDLVDLLERGDNPLSLSALRPTLIAIPDPTSYNQDHAATGSAAVSALRPGPDCYRHQPELVLIYEEVGDVWTGSQTAQAHNFFVTLTAEDLDRKIEGLRVHDSQWRDHPHTRSENALRGLAAVRGAQCGTNWAEAYRCMRWRS
ncbi:PIG-L deacetylase family protein [Nocardia sp. CDC160]|uniref:PIG-L deacetylase family protein n=1 Tax=Nocardia sp. CDC160 TaxID=3112166 RepID=UPI002DB7B63E|nr:PIG-L deacetylase family protein [Nocardia sp. CDC160]MEC3915523.1 PIG-L deacetylase family protein [Nocardia sp. CDC160]